ncbi:hypothetical protein [Leeuwenhoekiella parthenopeia]|uniref:Restriction endonuclease n=1 Tax=Leeuwenhoekiella parthenopeia TaxID=2890320 RepID=A0ABS8GXH7_9FLAO|nr:hypothetical protein [Leeuwenhoekiella parthenopeia]MCC4214715.1 hypothetical protein [Leeuwenhoekiella parthenopeia]
MTNHEFIDKIIEAYKQSRSLIYGNGGYQIKRGMSHSSSGKAEDLFSVFIAEKLDSKELEFFVDQGISFRTITQKRAKLFKPDLAILKNDTLTHYFDLKMDLGWNRDLEQYLVAKNDFINKLKESNDVWYKTHIEGKGSIKVSKKLTYQIVVLSGANGNKAAHHRNVDLAASLENVNLYVLTSGGHLNFYTPEEKEKVIFNDNAFDKLISDTKATLL